MVEKITCMYQDVFFRVDLRGQVFLYVLLPSHLFVRLGFNTHLAAAFSTPSMPVVLD